MTSKLAMGKFGLKENPIGQYCSMELNDRIWLGTIEAAKYNDTLGVIQLTVRHFNGELWPFQPRALAVDILRWEEGQ